MIHKDFNEIIFVASELMFKGSSVNCRHWQKALDKCLGSSLQQENTKEEGLRVLTVWENFSCLTLDKEIPLLN